MGSRSNTHKAQHRFDILTTLWRMIKSTSSRICAAGCSWSYHSHIILHTIVKPPLQPSAIMMIPMFCLMQILFVTLSTRCSADLISLPPPAGEQSTGALLLLAASCQLSSPAFTTCAAAPSRRGISSSGWQDKQALASQSLLELCQVQDGMG